MLNKSDTNVFQFLSRIFLMMFILGGAAMISACENQGPAEEAGEAIDETVEETGDAIEEATD